MYIRGLIPRNFAELVEAVPIDAVGVLAISIRRNRPLHYLVFLISCDCYCSMAVPFGTVG